MNWWRKVETIIKPWMIVLLFIAVLLFGFYKESKAEVSAEIGAPFLSGEFSKGAALTINQTWDNRWRLGMGYYTEQWVTPRKEPKTYVRPNLYVHGQRMVGITEKLYLGIGFGYFNAKTRWNGSQFVASLSVEYDFTNSWSFRYRHFSSAGSASPNMGQDSFNIAYKFR